ncbi:hypothetical protein [Cellulomonas sp. Leaf395]|uniref:hypothetical protein n=1 Tax=Cellulomonas sp. Leaf395 TaxID=1736362 RepID=UPI0006FD42E4|nr:hypothetical protein [Cellulomonas sp. Leaf395]KQT02013.1 hypothetical protein ASG23_01175 [Cellulomonas sp. Leaf395]
MIKRVVFVAGVSAGYLFGTPSGRRQLEKMKVMAIDFWHDPRVQEYVQEYEAQATAFAKKQGAAVWEKAVDTAKSAASSSTTKYPTSSSSTYPTNHESPTVVEPIIDADDANPGQR